MARAAWHPNGHVCASGTKRDRAANRGKGLGSSSVGKSFKSTISAAFERTRGRNPPGCGGGDGRAGENTLFVEAATRDPGDEMVLETTINGRADALVTFNVRDFGSVPARFGIEVMIPRDVIGRMRP